MQSLIGIAGLIAIVIMNPPPSTEQEIEARKAQTEATKARKRQEQQQKVAKAANDRALCNTASVCKKYGKVRQDCAVAGNFRNCVQVKMGENTSYAETDCNDDGTPRWQPDTPNPIVCFLLNYLP